jgi:hypothetical protein
VELARYGRHAVIVVAPNKSIERIDGVALVPLPDGRALISLDKDTGVAEFEVLVRDALDSDSTSPSDRSSLQLLGDILRSARRSRKVQLSQRNIIVLEETDAAPGTVRRQNAVRAVQGRATYRRRDT